MLAVIIIYIVALLVIGLLAMRHGKNTSSDLITSSRDHGTWLSALSASASSESGWVMLGLVGTAYTSGISCLWLLPGCIAGYLFNWCVIGPRIHELSHGNDVESFADLFHARFPNASVQVMKAIKAVVVVSITVFLTVYASAQFSATGKAANAMLGWDYSTGVLLGVGLIVIYTAVGGLRAVSWTDVPQAALMFFSLLILPFIILASTTFKVGFVADIRATDASLLSLTGGATGWAALGFSLGWIGIGLGYPGQPHVLRRFMTTSSKGIYNRGAIISLVWSQVVFAGAILIGLAARLRFPGLADPEQALPHAALQLLPPAAAGVAMAGVLSAIWSTADGQLFEASTTIFTSLKRKGAATRPVMVRALVVVVGIVAGLLALLKVQVIFDVVLYAWGALGAGLGATLSVVLLWKRATPAGALAGLVAGPLVLYLWKTVFKLGGTLYELIPAFAAGVLATVIVSAITSPKKAALNSNAPA